MPNTDIGEIKTRQFSPGTRMRIFEHREENDIENELRSCCSKTPTDKRLLILSAQIALSVCVSIWSATMIALADRDEDKSVYASMLSSTLSYWLGRSMEQSKN